MQKELKIYLFRHGRTDYNLQGKFTGWKDSKLTSRGIKDAKKIAKKLKKIKFEIAVQTRLSRSKDTLSYVLKFHPECKKIIEDNRMIERSYGILEGISHEEFIKRLGNQEYDLLSSGDAIENIKSRRLRRKLKRFLGEEEYKSIHRGYKNKVPRGESFYDVEKRVKPFIIWLKRYMKKNKVSVAISAHGNSIRLFRKIMEKSSIEEMEKWVIPYDKVFVYKI